MSLTNDSTYDGVIAEATLNLAYQSEHALDAVFTVEIEGVGGAVDRIKCKHHLFGDKLEQTKEILDSLDVPWPPDLLEMEKADGKSVRVWISEFNGRQFGKINRGGARADDPEAIEAAIRKLNGEDEPPF